MVGGCKVKMGRIIAFIAIFIAHYLLSFVSWSMSGQNDGFRAAWNFLAFPILLLPDAWLNDYFEIASLMNSAAWALAIVAPGAAIRAAREG